MSRWLLLLLTIVLANVSFAEPLSKSDKLKAAYLFNFTRYIEWPKAHFDRKNTDLTICSFADQQFNDFLAQLVNGRTTASNQNILIIKPEEVLLTSCDLVFLKEAPPVQLNLANSIVIGDDKSWNRHGMTIHFFVEDRRLRFEINLEKAHAQNLTISSELLKLARVVNHVGATP